MDKRSIHVFCLLATLLLSVNLMASKRLQEAAAYLVGQIERSSPGKLVRIGVLELTNMDRQVSYLAHHLTEHISHRAVQSDKFVVVERTHIEKIFEELALAKSGLVDPAGLVRIGKLLGVEAVLTGTLIQTSDGFVIDLRLIDTRGNILAAASYLLELSDQWIRENHRILYRFGMETPRFVPEQARSSPELSPEPPQIYLKPGNLLRNGDFSEHWSKGWKRELTNVESGGSHVALSDCASCRSGHAVKIRHVGKSGTWLEQTVRVYSTALVFRAGVQMRQFSTGLVIFGFVGEAGVATLEVRYLDKQHQFLGRTVYYHSKANPFSFMPGAPKPPRDKSREHFIALPSQRWQRLRLPVEQEIIDYLPGVAAQKVRYIKILLYCGGGDSRSGAELIASDLELTYENPTEF